MREYTITLADADGVVINQYAIGCYKKDELDAECKFFDEHEEIDYFVPSEYPAHLSDLCEALTDDILSLDRMMVDP